MPRLWRITLRLAIDATPILPGRKGLGLFLENLLDHFPDHCATIPLIVYIDEAFWEEAQKKWPSLHVKRVNSKPSILWEQIHLPRILKKDNVGVLFTGRDRTCCEPKVRTVVYLFEVPNYRINAILKGNSAWYSKISARYSLRRFGNIAKKVGRFLVSSQATLEDLARLYKIPPVRIEIVYPGVHEGFKKPASPEIKNEARSYFSEGRPYVLHFATGDPRDNSGVTLEAFARALPALNSGISLLLAGTSDKEVKHLKKEAERAGIADHTYYTGRLKGDLLVRAYQGAEVYLDPTFYEGFGFQLAEAMACGTPVLSSKVTSVPEVVGKGGLLFDPTDVEGFALGLQRLMTDPDLREELSLRGRERATRFSWPETTRRIITLLESELRNRRYN